MLGRQELCKCEVGRRFILLKHAHRSSLFSTRIMAEFLIGKFFFSKMWYTKHFHMISNTSVLEFVRHLRQPVVLRSSSEDWNLTLCSSWCEALLQPEWGMTTVLISVVRASRMMVIFTASHDERFHRTPAGEGEQRQRVFKITVSLSLWWEKNTGHF